MKKFLFIFVVLLQSCSGNSQDQPADARFMGLEAHIDSLLAEYHAVGLSVAVVEKGTTIYAKGFGYRDYENKLPANAQTIFGIGSCTKAFTAAVLGVERDQGKLAFTDAPSKYIKDLSFYSGAMNDSIQIEHLLTHSSGVGNRSSESTAILFETSNARELIPRIKYLRPAGGVGQELMYNNLMYTLAGMVGEDITGNSWADNLQYSLFDPIGMSRTFIDFAPGVAKGNYSLGYVVDSITPTTVMPEVMVTRAPAGAIFSTADDMSLWLKTWLAKGKIGGKQVLPTSYVSDAISERILWPSNPNDTTNVASKYYGYGWITWEDRGYRRVEHSGGVSGYGSNVVFFPEAGIGLVVLTNQTASSLPYSVTSEIVSRILPILENDPHEAQFVQVQTILPADTPTTINKELPPSLDLSNFVGAYQHPGFGKVTVSYEGETLYAEFPMTRLRLTHHENNVFHDHYTMEVPMVMWNFMQLDFRANYAGKIDTLMINLDAVLVAFERVVD